jgi:hypothetical protein
MIFVGRAGSNLRDAVNFSSARPTERLLLRCELFAHQLDRNIERRDRLAAELSIACFSNSAPTFKEPQRGIEPRAVLFQCRYGILLYPMRPKPPLYSPRRSLNASARDRAWRLPAVTSFNGSRSRILMLSLFCFFISGAHSSCSLTLR